jgi:hypothetical protein
MLKPRNRYRLYKVLKECPICGKEYNEHWKVVNHIRKTKSYIHQSFLKAQEKEVINSFINNKGRVDDLTDMLYKCENIFCGISYMRIVEILEKYIQREKITEIQRKRISNVMKTVPKTADHNKKVSQSVKQAWKDGKFNTEENKEARRQGYINRKSFAGKNNPMYGKPSPKGSGRGKGGIRKDIGHYVRSTWEANVCRVLQLIKRKYKYEHKRFYIDIGKESYSYCPDVYFPSKDFYYEIKGHAKSSADWKCTCKTCEKNRKMIPAIIKKYNIKVIIIGREEYNKFKRRFKILIPNWEK